MTPMKIFIAELAAKIAAGIVQHDDRYTDRGRVVHPTRRSPLDVARYAVQIAEEIVGLVHLGPVDVEELAKRREARALSYAPGNDCCPACNGTGVSIVRDEMLKLERAAGCCTCGGSGGRRV